MSEPLAVSCIIPVFNDAARIDRVLDAVIGHPLLAEVIVVDDGSSDGTLGVLRARPGITLVALTRNAGKSHALREGLARAAGPLLLLLDGDLVGLEPSHVTALLRPVLDGNAATSISLRQNAPWLWRRIGLDYISGELVMPKALLEPRLTALEHLPAFGFEVWLNRLWIELGCRIAVVTRPGVESPSKRAKFGARRGLRAAVRMMRDIFRTVPPSGAAAQIRAMLRLCIPSPPRSGRT